MNDRKPLTPAQRLSRGLSGREIPRTIEARDFRPLDPATLEHLPKSAAVNVPPANAIPGQPPMWPDRVAALMDANPAGTQRLLADILAAAPSTTVVPARTPRRLGRMIVLPVVAAIAALGIGAALPAAPAQAATRVTAQATATEGPGLNILGHHIGSYWLGGRLMDCIRFGDKVGDGPTHTGTADARIVYVEDKWVNTTSNIQSADAYLAVNSLVGNAAFNAELPAFESHLPDGGARVRAMVAEATRLAGPWKVSVDVPTTLPGTMAVAHVTVTSASGAPVPAAQVTVRGVGATVSLATTTDGAGVAAVEVRPTALAYTVAASVQSPGTAVWTNSPSAGHQILVGAGPLQTISATGCASACPASATVSITAPCHHDGHTVTVTWTATSVPGTVVGTLTVSGQEADTALTQGGTTTATTTVPAGATVTVGWKVTDGAGAVLASDTLTSLTVQS